MSISSKELIEREVALIDEKNYLLNIIEEADETGLSVEEVIQNRVDDIYNELDSIAINK